MLDIKGSVLGKHGPSGIGGTVRDKKGSTRYQKKKERKKGSTRYRWNCRFYSYRLSQAQLMSGTQQNPRN